MNDSNRLNRHHNPPSLSPPPTGQRQPASNPAASDPAAVDLSEQALIQRAQQGDDAAYELLMRQHQARVFRLAYLLLGDAGDAEDVAQDTFIQAFAALHRFEVGRALRPWLLRITTNLAYNRRRAVGRYLRAVQRYLRAAPTDITPDTAAEDAKIVWDYVRRLGQADQQIIYLRYFLELSPAETAEVLDIPQGTVKSRLHRALERLRALMSNSDIAALWEGGRS